MILRRGWTNWIAAWGGGGHVSDNQPQTYMMIRSAFRVLIIGIVACLFGCGRQPPSASAGSAPKSVMMIDYAHDTEGIFYHGTFSLIDGQVGATWTVDDGKGKKSRDIAMTEQTFRSIWDALGTLPEFAAGAAKDPEQKMDPSVAHIIGAASSINGRDEIRTYVISNAVASEGFREWLNKIGYAGK